MNNITTSNLSALAEVVRCLTIYPSVCTTSKLCRFLELPEAVKLEVLCRELYSVCDDITIEEFKD